jgi:hypothetical protein
LSKLWHYYASGDDIILDNKLPQAGPSFIKEREKLPDIT